LEILKPSVLLFFFLIFLWGLLFCYTFIPWIAGISVYSKEQLDLTVLIIPFFGFTFVNLGLWLTLYTLYPFVSRRVENHQRNLIELRKCNKASYQPLVSIIIPGRNEEEVIRKTILNILSQTYKNIEIIMVSHNSTDRTCEEARVVDDRVKVYDFQTTLQGKGAALNYGIDHANGEYICIVDSDGKLAANFLENAMPLFDEGYAAVQGLITSSNKHYNIITQMLTLEGDLYSNIFMAVRDHFDKRVPLGGTGLIIKKEILLKVGKFTNSLIDDFELSFRLYRNKYRIAFAPLSIDWDEKPPLLNMIFKQRARWMKGHLDHLKSPVAEPKDIIGHIYWLSPVSLISSLIALSIASFNNLYYLFFGQFAYSFSALPVGLWFILICINYFFQVYFLMLNRKHSRIQCFIYPLLLSPFSTYWYICIIKAFFVKGWASTKTTHGFQLSVPVIEQTGRSRGGSTKRPGDTN
jgi:cellulose synthase/poly-beta-1,6-N-acetylglucosamine synthase-like glycosyltransferase